MPRRNNSWEARSTAVPISMRWPPRHFSSSPDRRCSTTPTRPSSSASTSPRRRPRSPTRRPELSDLGPVFSKALAKSPDDRYGTRGDFAAALRARIGSIADELGVYDATQRALVSSPRRKAIPRSRPRLAVAALAVLAVLGVVDRGVLRRRMGRAPVRPPSARVGTQAAAAPDKPVVPVVLIGADCATLGAAGQTPTRPAGLLRQAAEHRRRHVVALPGPGPGPDRHSRRGRADLSRQASSSRCGCASRRRVRTGRRAGRTSGAATSSGRRNQSELREAGDRAAGAQSRPGLAGEFP